MFDPSRHAEDRNPLEALGRSIPGFKGYLEKEYRRDSDYLARQALANRLDRAKPSLDTYMRNLVDAGNLDALPQCERLRTRIDGLLNAIRSAERGYSGIFDYVRVDEQRLTDVYDQDMQLLDDAREAAETLEALATSTAPPAEALPPVERQIEEFSRLFARRGEALKGLGPEVP